VFALPANQLIRSLRKQREADGEVAGIAREGTIRINLSLYFPRLMR
jgi:hypothetical protein